MSTQTIGQEFKIDYQEIVKMGKIALPYIFAELAKEPTHWFHALKQITNENPVKETSKGNIQLMTNDWLSLSKTQGNLFIDKIFPNSLLEPNTPNIAPPDLAFLPFPNTQNHRL